MSTGSASRYRESYRTPFGTGFLVWNGGVVESNILPGTAPQVSGLPASGNTGSELAVRLERYFAGCRIDFSGFTPGPPERVSDFSVAVADALSRVPYGSTLSYGELAAAAGHPRAQRAVGSWLARNPLPVIIPCHRVIRADGALGRYSGGAGWKLRLLQLEGFTRDIKVESG